MKNTLLLACLASTALHGAMAPRETSLKTIYIVPKQTTSTATGAVSLRGDVNGISYQNVVSTVGGQSAADVAAATIAANAATSADVPNTIVKRDLNGDFTTNMITLVGSVLNPTDAATKEYVDTAVVTGVVIKPPALVRGDSDLALSGLQTIDGVTLVAQNRVLLTSQTDPIENGLWLAQAGAWTRPTDFSVGTLAEPSYVLITAGTQYNGTSWVCTTSDAVIGTDPITFVQFTLPSQTNAANVGTGDGHVFRDKTGHTLNFKTLAAGSHISVTNNTDDITLATDATSANTPGTVVARNGSGNFSANTITANLAGNASTATIASTAAAFSGPLAGDVTGTQAATVVTLISGQTAANVAAATIAANAATSTDSANTIVKRDASGKFSTEMISLVGSVLNPTDAATKQYVDTAVLTGIVIKRPALVASNTDLALSGIQTVDSIPLSASDRILLTNQTDPVENGLWLVQTGAWTRPADFSTGSLAETSYVLTTSGVQYNGTSWVCTTSDAVIDTDPITFVQFTLPGQTTAANVGTGDGHIFRDKTGHTLNLKTLAAGSHMSVTNNTDDIALATDATDVNAPGTLVARNGSGNFSANAITANLVGNATSATTATTATNFTGSLAGDVTGPQAATLVALVAGQTAANVAAATVAANAATSTDSANTIVKRDASGKFSTEMISLVGSVLNPTDAATKQYVDTATTLGIVIKAPVRVTSNADLTLSGTQTVDSVDLSASDRILLTNQTDPIENGLWLVQAGAWTRPTDFATGNLAETAFVLTTSGITYTGTSWVCTTSDAVIDTDPITFVQFSMPGQVTAANVGTGDGHIFRDKTGHTINLKTLAAGSHISVTNNTDDITLATDATDVNAPGTLVARNGSGNFSANAITANLVGNATSATTATTATNFSGSLAGDVTGTQGATVVSLVGGQTAAHVATATIAANAATNSNNPNTIVKRDLSGNFVANTVIFEGTTLCLGGANLQGNVIFQDSTPEFTAGADFHSGTVTFEAGSASTTQPYPWTFGGPVLYPYIYYAGTAINRNGPGPMFYVIIGNCTINCQNPVAGDFFTIIFPNSPSQNASLTYTNPALFPNRVSTLNSSTPSVSYVYVPTSGGYVRAS